MHRRLSVHGLCLLFVWILFSFSCVHKPSENIRLSPGQTIYLGNPLDQTAFSPDQAKQYALEKMASRDERQDNDVLRISHPYDNALFPVDMASPEFTWERPDAQKRTWILRIDLPRDGSQINVVCLSTRWVPPKAVWEHIKKQSLSKPAVIKVFAVNSSTGTVEKSAAIRIRTSADPVNAPIVYQQMMIPIEVGNKHPETAKWLMGDISAYTKPKTLIENQNTCGMCHHFSNDGNVFGFDLDIDGDKGAYGLSLVKKNMTLDKRNFISWTNYQDDGQITLGLFSKLSPNGRFVVSTIREKRVFFQVNDLDFSELFFPYKGILACYDRETRTFFDLLGADDPKFVHVGPDWSPDGKTLVFSRAKAQEKFDSVMGKKAFLKAGRLERIQDLNRKFPIQYDLYILNFNRGKGGKPRPLKGAAFNKKSNYWPRFSPDGKWIVFTQSDNAMMNQPDSRLYIIPAQGGTARLMNCSRDYHNSWHSWSPNSRWIVFSSKVNTPYTQLFIAHVDENGMDSPPVLINRFYSGKLASVMPEFVNIRPDAIKKIQIKP